MKGRATALALVAAIALGVTAGAFAAPEPNAPGEAAFASRVFAHRFDAAVRGCATGDFYRPSFAYEPIPVDRKYQHAITFQMSQFFPGRREALAGNGPLVLFSDDLDVLVFSPLDHPYVSLIDVKDGAIQYGIEGEVEEIPAGFEHRFVLVEGKGVNATIEAWGERLRAAAGKARVDRYADAGLSYLGYWTDAGAAYYWHTLPGKTPEETLLAVKAEADRRAIPYRYFQIDSWWYFTNPPGLCTRGAKRWAPRPDVFPDRLPAFRRKLGLPLVAHARWLAPDNDDRPRFAFVVGDKVALPLGRAYYDYVMANAKAWGIETYEQDWLMNQFWWLPYLRNGVDHAEDWMKAMDDAAAEQGLTMQICMAGAAHVMDSVRRRSWTTVRSSIDYVPERAKEAYWPQFHIANMIVHAAGLLPFKDNFRTAEKHGQAEALISVLSAGMVGPSDRVDQQNAEILLRTCRADGLLLKPDRPAAPIDAMFLPHARPFITQTYSRREGIGQWTYLAAYHLARRHPARRNVDRLFASLTYDGREMGRFFVFPDRVTDWRVDLEKELGLRGSVAVYNWRTRRVSVESGAFDLPPIQRLDDFDYLVFAPVLSNGLALIGETAKYVTVADKRFLGIEVAADALRVRLAGAPGEQITLDAYDTRDGRVLSATAVVPSAGETNVRLESTATGGLSPREMER